MNKNDTQRRDIERNRAEFAYDKVIEAVNHLSASAKKEYKSYCKKIPMLIKTNGLASTFAFVFSKGNEGGRIQTKKAYGQIYSQTQEWLVQNGMIENGRLMKEFISKDSSEYRALTIEVLALFNWLRRFAEGMIAGEADDNS